MTHNGILFNQECRPQQHQYSLPSNEGGSLLSHLAPPINEVGANNASRTASLSGIDLGFAARIWIEKGGWRETEGDGLADVTWQESAGFRHES